MSTTSSNGRLTALLALLVLPAVHVAAADLGHRHVEARIDPTTGDMQVALDMTTVPLEATSELTFLLHADLEVDSLVGEALAGFSVEPYAWPDAPHLKHIAQVTVRLHEPVAPGQPVSLQWQYGGTLHDDHIEMGQAAMTPHWMELPGEALWVPMIPDVRQRYTWTASVELPEGYDLVATGGETQHGTHWKLVSNEPSIDMPLIASDRMQRHEAVADGGVTVTVHHAGSDEALVDYVATHATEIVSRYARRFQAGLEAPELDITLSPLKRDTAHAYARPGLIGLYHGIEPGPRLLKLVAHESAHLWWSKSSDGWSRHNFLNESFAEYFAWVELGRVHGQADYDQRIDKAREDTRDAPRFDDWTQLNNGLLTYVKGPLLLHDLHERIGPEAFDRFVQALQADRVGTVEDMLATLEAAAGAEHSRWLKDAM